MLMYDRVARAIYAEMPIMDGDGEIGWEELSGETRARFGRAALKAIAAMRNPTDAMLAAGDRNSGPRDAANVWERMIFTALYELEA